MGQAGDTTVAAPKLPDCAKVREPTGQVVLLKISFFLLTPNDVPLGIAEVCVVFRT